MKAREVSEKWGLTPFSPPQVLDPMHPVSAKKAVCPHFSATSLACLVVFGAVLALAAPFVVTDYRDAASRLIGAALSDDTGLARLEYLCDRIGNRVSGSAALEKAVIWAEQEMKSAGLENVRTIPVKVPHWVRGRQSLEMLEPLSRPVAMLVLGASIGKPPQG